LPTVTEPQIFKNAIEFVRVIGEREFAGARYLLIEKVLGVRGSVEAVTPDYLTADYQPATEKQWADAVRIAVGSEVERQAARQARLNKSQT
jgi:hypothetical protein